MASSMMTCDNCGTERDADDFLACGKCHGDMCPECLDDDEFCVDKDECESCCGQCGCCDGAGSLNSDGWARCTDCDDFHKPDSCALDMEDTSTEAQRTNPCECGDCEVVGGTCDKQMAEYTA